MSRIRLVPVVAIPPAFDNIVIDTISDQDRPQITYLLGQKSHRECLVKQPELPALTLLVIWIPEDATVEQRPMYVSDHTPDVSRGVRRFAGWWVFDAIEIVGGRGVEMQRISLIK